MVNHSVANAGERPRVLWLSHLVPYPPKAGVVMRSYYLLRALAEWCDVDLFCLNQSRLLRSLLPGIDDPCKYAIAELQRCVARVRVCSLPEEGRRYGKHRVALISLFSRTPYSVSWLYSEEAKADLAEFTEGYEYDLLHVDTEALIPYLPAVKCARHLALNHHNAEAHMMDRRAAKEGAALRRLYYSVEAQKLLRYAKRSFPAFDLHLTCSEEDRQRLFEIAPSLSVVVVPNGVEMPDVRHYSAPSLKASKALFIGGLDWYPNADAAEFLVHEVWPHVVARLPAAELHFVGKAPPQWLTECAAVDRSIVVHGFVPDIRSHYEGAGVFVCPIRDGGGTKLKILHAMAHGVPIVAHPIAIEGLDVEADRDLLVGETPIELAGCIARVLTDRSLARQLRDSAWSVVAREYSTDAIGKVLISNYVSLLEQRAPESA